MNITMLRIAGLAAALTLVASGDAWAVGARGGGGGGRGGGGGMSRPSPAVSRPSPSVSRPAATPASRPSASTRPSYGSVPSIVANRPGTGASRPSTLPATKPGSGIAGQPSTRPASGAGAIAKPGTLPSTRPGTGTTRPSTRPSAGDVGDFLGIQQRPGAGKPTTLPATRPGGIAQKPATRPGDVTINNRPVNINKNINSKIGWQNLNQQQLNNFHNNWQKATTLPAGGRNWLQSHPDRYDHWHNWGSSVRNHWGNYHRYGWFNDRWWATHLPAHGGWWHNYSWYNRPWRYWWTFPTWAAVGTWFGGGGGWSQPCYYDYGDGGNVVYEDNSVTINGQQVGSTEEFAQSAADLATVPPPASEEQVKKAEWLSLGTFAVSTNKEETDPTRVLQLAVSKEGIVSGTLYNTQTEKSQAVQGKVDKQTQRVAMRVGDNENIVIETGIFNLTQDEAPILIHFGTERVEQGLLVRLDPPAEDGQAAAPAKKGAEF